MNLITKLTFWISPSKKTEQTLSVSVYRKPTATDAIIPSSSCHPYEQKVAAIRFIADRIITYPIDDEQERKEYLTAKQILTNNQYDTNLLDNTLDKLTKTAKKKRESADQAQEDNNTTTKWAKFTYVGLQTKFITKLFRKTNIKIAFTTENNIAKFLTRKKDDDSNKYKRSGVYQLSCQTCNKKYIGQTGSSSQKTLPEHLNDFKNK